MSEKILYFAYGSNLYTPQMLQRCPDAVEISSAVLPDWRLVERKYADIEQACGECVHGALYAVSKSDLAALDLYEGYPNFYTRVTVQVADPAGVYYEALVYTMTPECKNERFEQGYSNLYRSICSAGAEYWGIPDAFSTDKKE